MYLLDKLLLNEFEAFKLLIEVPGDQQHGIFEFASTVDQRALAKMANHDGRTDRDPGDQQRAAKDEPADRIGVL